MKKICLAFVILFLIFTWGCGKRKNPTLPTYPQGQIWESIFICRSLSPSDTELIERSVKVYVPPDYRSTGPAGKGYPVLYLLHDFRGNDDSFDKFYNLAIVADELLAREEIIPFLIVMPDGFSVQGGSYYTNHQSHFKYEDYIINDMMNHVDTTFYTAFNLSQGQVVRDDLVYRAYRAVSGHGMGGYGAMKLALKHSDSLFSAVSAMNAPLVFDSLVNLFPKVFEENDVTYGDTADYYKIEASPKNYVTAMIISMAAAFSPHDETNPDTSTYLRKYDIDLPFGADGDTVSEIWSKWLDHDPAGLLEDPIYQGYSVGMPIYLEAADNDELGFKGQMSGFYQLLVDKGLSPTFNTYVGYSGYPAGHSNLIHQRLREILKFHSEHFPTEPPE